MPCDRKLKPRQTPKQRAEEIRKAVAKLNAGLTAGSIKAYVSREGGITFQGFAELDRDGVTDGCAYRRIMATGSMSAKLAIMQAEQKAGRSVDKQAVAQGLHSHDGGATWHHHKG